MAPAATCQWYPSRHAVQQRACQQCGSYWKRPVASPFSTSKETFRLVHWVTDWGLGARAMLCIQKLFGIRLCIEIGVDSNRVFPYSNSKRILKGLFEFENVLRHHYSYSMRIFEKLFETPPRNWPRKIIGWRPNEYTRDLACFVAYSLFTTNPFFIWTL